jgi:hypothetical protein
VVKPEKLFFHHGRYRKNHGPSAKAFFLYPGCSFVKKAWTFLSDLFNPGFVGYAVHGKEVHLENSFMTVK